MLRTLSINSGSRLSLKAWLRCGCSEKARQMRLMLLSAQSGTNLGQRTRGPVGSGGRLAFQSARQHAFDRSIAQAAPRAGTGVHRAGHPGAAARTAVATCPLSPA